MYKRYECDDLTEYRGYAIFDLSEVALSRDDFRDEDGDIIGYAYHNYLVDETDSIMTGEEVAETLNRLSFKCHQTKLYAKLLNITTGSLYYLQVKALEYDDILFVRKSLTKPTVVKVYVRNSYDEKKLESFRDEIPLGVVCEFIPIEKMELGIRWKDE